MSTRSEAIDRLFVGRKARNTSNLFEKGEDERQARLVKLIEAKTKEPIVLKSGLYSFDAGPNSNEDAIKEE